MEERDKGEWTRDKGKKCEDMLPLCLLSSVILFPLSFILSRSHLSISPFLTPRN